MTMLESMARNMYARTPQSDAVPYDSLPDNERNMFERFAWAALDALLEPTTGMILAVCAKAKEEQCRPIEVHRRDAADFIEAAIKAAMDGK